MQNIVWTTDMVIGSVRSTAAAAAVAIYYATDAVAADLAFAVVDLSVAAARVGAILAWANTVPVR